MRVCVAPARDDGDELPPVVEFVSNFGVHDSTEQTPCVLNSGRQLPPPMDRAVGDEVPAAYDFVGAVLRAIDAEHNMEMAQLRQKSYADCRRRAEESEAGKEVLLGWHLGRASCCLS